MNKPVLITGASGFVGAHLALELATAGETIVALGGQNECPDEVKAAAAHSRQADLAEPGAAASVLAEFNPGAVVHAAALANPGRCAKDPQAAVRQNVQVTAQLVEACLALPEPARPLLIFVSTDMVYDGSSTAPAGGFSETDAAQPLSTYSKTKFAAEELILGSDVRAVVLRTALVYGRQIGGLYGFMSWLVDGLRSGGCELFFDEYRTPVWAHDLAKTAQAVLKSPLDRFKPQNPGLKGAGGERLFHVGGGTRVSRVELGEAVAAELGFSPSAIRPASRLDAPDGGTRPADISFNSTRIEQTFGIRTSALADGLRRMRHR